MLDVVSGTNRHDCRDLIQIFDNTFLTSHATCLRGGVEEPLYTPAAAPGQFNQIWFTHDYFASALHEVAHWCVAGPARRRLQDYGYWYSPDGRTEQQQAEFERVEVRPQALEWLFARASGSRFRPSADNLASGVGPGEAFVRAIHAQAHHFCRNGVNARVERFLSALIAYYGTARDLSDLLRIENFHWSEVA